MRKITVNKIIFIVTISILVFLISRELRDFSYISNPVFGYEPTLVSILTSIFFDFIIALITLMPLIIGCVIIAFLLALFTNKANSKNNLAIWSNIIEKINFNKKLIKKIIIGGVVLFFIASIFINPLIILAPLILGYYSAFLFIPLADKANSEKILKHLLCLAFIFLSLLFIYYLFNQYTSFLKGFRGFYDFEQFMYYFRYKGYIPFVQFSIDTFTFILFVHKMIISFTSGFIFSLYLIIRRPKK